MHLRFMELGNYFIVSKKKNQCDKEILGLIRLTIYFKMYIL